MHGLSSIFKTLPDFKFRFEKDTEKMFLAHYINNSLVVIRAGYFLGIFLFAIFGILDVWMVPETLNIAWLIRFAVVIPVMLFTILISFTDFFKRYNQIILIITSAMVGLGIVVMIAFSKPTELGYIYYYSGLTLVIFIIGLLASYHIEKMQRSNFLQNRTIINENVRVQRISEMLMKKNEEISVQSLEIEEQSKRLSNQNHLLEAQSQSIGIVNKELLVLNEKFREQSKELEYTNIKLEEKVRERTEELQRSNDELIIARDKAQASDRLKTAFMQNISHEVRTPLNGILGFSSIMADPEFDGKDKTAFLAMLKNSSDRLVTTITDYMDISLIVSGNMEVRKKCVPVNEQLSSLVGKYDEVCAQKGIAFNFVMNQDCDGLSVQTDPELFRKIIDHLLDNAVKFTSVGSVTLSCSLNENNLEFHVCDTGVGISKESHERIFESFIQEEVAVTRVHEGSGLGLSVVKGLLKLLGGSIRLESVKGEGSSFFVAIPCEMPVQTIQADEVEKTVTHRQESPVILIVEDDDMNRRLLEIILARHVKRLLLAINGKEAVEICRVHPEVSLVLMDLKMPVMNGYEATRAIKSFRRSLPVIAITAFAMNSDEQLARDAGCDDYLTKPVSMSSLKKIFNKFGIEM